MKKWFNNLLYNIKKYKPLKVFSIKYGYGYWFGEKVYFFDLVFAIVPSYFLIGDITWASGKDIKHGRSKSWDRYDEYLSSK